MNDMNTYQNIRRFITSAPEAVVNIMHVLKKYTRGLVTINRKAPISECLAKVSMYSSTSTESKNVTIILFLVFLL